jgi:hypothetical protein
MEESSMIKKDTIIVHCGNDRSGCSWYRQRFQAMLLMTIRAGEINPVITPFEVTDGEVLTRAAAIVIGRAYKDENGGNMIRHYHAKRKKYGYRIFVDYDDLIFSLDGTQATPEYNTSKIDTVEAGKYIATMLQKVDGVTVSTHFLKQCIVQLFGFTAVTVIPNAIPRYCFGRPERRDQVRDVPRVLYAGGIYHFTEDNHGDFSGPWIPWLYEAVKRDKIELHMFDRPTFLGDLADKVTVHGGETALEFPAVDTSIQPDIYLAPLQENNFNRAKSNLKLLEATAVGAAFLGSDFEGSPYTEAHPLSKVMPDTTPEQLEIQFQKLCRHYGEVMDYQFRLMEMQGYWMDSDHYLKRYLHTYFGDFLRVNGRKV